MAVKSKKSFKEQAAGPQYVIKLVNVRRVAQVERGGRVFGFSALVVAGDGNGRVGFGLASAKEVPSAISKATEFSKRNMVTIPIVNGTIYHKIKSSYGAADVLMMPAPDGTGVIAGSAMRAVFEVMGIKNIIAKCIGSTNPINVVRATVKGLLSMKTPQMVAKKRGKQIEEIWSDNDE